ncbi:F-box/LRR-repeat protein 14 [Frankliniella fusca]|uniref:F-box/LRR-repeat protein 14 n=1 Tax=Frankliniella fusca TaxID=407009 RepID=A0AAE1HRT6_9NEOP|nr:F-box/LRR-repeat protein 14 [Frankliniella fusca]
MLLARLLLLVLLESLSWWCFVLPGAFVELGSEAHARAVEPGANRRQRQAGALEMALVQVEPLCRLGLQALAAPLLAAVDAVLADEEAPRETCDGLGDAEDGGGRTVVDAVRRYLEAAPGDVLEALLQAVLARSDVPGAARCAALRLLLRADVRSLGVGVLAAEHHARAVRCLRAQGAGLRALDLKGAWLRGVDLDAFCEALRSLGALRVLGVPHAATDKLLEAVAEHCPKLTALDVSGETDVSRRGLEALCRGAGAPKALQVLDVGNLAEASVSAEDAAFLLRSLPNLRSLGSYARVGAALLALQDQDGEDAERAALRLEYLRDIGTTTRAADAILALCPSLRAVYLDAPEPGVLPALAALPLLADLKLHQFDVRELERLLSTAGAGVRVTELELLFGRAGPLDLTRLATLCPGLQRLECYFVDCSSSGRAAWRALQSVGVFHAQLARHALLDLALGAPRLQRLGVGCALPDLSDTDVQDLCGAELQEVWLAQAVRLTQAAALCFLTGCPRLTSLGELSGWDVTPDQVEELRRHCELSNLDVGLWYFPRDGALGIFEA